MRFTDDRIQELFQLGVLEKIGVDEDGDDIIIITEKSRDIEPELFRFRQDFLGITAIELWNRNIVDIFVENDEFSLALTPLAYEPNILAELPVPLKSSLMQIKHILRN